MQSDKTMNNLYHESGRYAYIRDIDNNDFIMGLDALLISIGKRNYVNILYSYRCSNFARKV